MKCSKCDFFKSKIHYLGHLISAHGISPLPDKLDTIKNMPVPKDMKEIKQFLGLTGYYRKFVPRFADISRHLTQLTKKEMKFMWTLECQKAFELLKSFLCGEPILAIVQLFYALQWAHNTAAEVAGHLAILGRTLSPDQFSFILKHLVRPLIQFNIPPSLPPR